MNGICNIQPFGITSIVAMKNLLATLLFCFSPNLISAQTGVIEIERYLHHSLVHYYYTNGTVEIRLGDSICPLQYKSTDYLPYCDSLKAGIYTIRYTTIFQQSFEKTIVNDGHSVQKDTIYFDDYEDDTTAFALSNQM